MNKAIGLIETKGLVSAIEALDASLKAANVQLVKKENSTGGWVTIVITGDVGSVKAAIEAGSAAAGRLSNLISSHVIPRMACDVVNMVNQQPQRLKTKLESDAKSVDTRELTDDLDHYKVVDLRHLARTLEISTMDRNKIKYANKEQLIDAIRRHQEGGE